MALIRKAVPADAVALADLAEYCFRETYEADNTAVDIDEHCAERFSEDIQRDEVADTNVMTLVAENAGTLIGFAQIRLHSPGQNVNAARPAELHRLYVLSKWHGHGIAHQIMTELFRTPALQQADALWLSVWEHNPRAITFYRKYGFQVAGDRIFQLGSDPQRDLVMAVKIGHHRSV